MNDRPRLTAALLLAAIAVLPLAGCKDAPSAAGIRTQIEREVPGLRLEREFHVRLGRFTFGLLKKVALWALDDEDDADVRRMIRHVRRVDVATYRVVALPEPGRLAGPFPFEKRLERRGWTTMVRQKEDDGQVWVLYRGDDEDAVRDLCVVALERDELTVVSVGGRLDKLIADAVADEPGEFAEIFGA